MPIVHSSCQNHLGRYLDDRLNFLNLMKERNSKAKKGIGIPRKLHNVLPRDSLILIYKSFIWPHLGYGVIIFDQPENGSLCKKKIESDQYNAALGTSREKVYRTSALYNTQNTRNITKYSCRIDAFRYSFFPWTINEWNKLNFNIQTSSVNIFTANVIKIIWPIPNSIFVIFNPLGLKLITRLWFGLSHLNEHRFNHNITDCINPLC